MIKLFSIYRVNAVDMRERIDSFLTSMEQYSSVRTSYIWADQGLIWKKIKLWPWSNHGVTLKKITLWPWSNHLVTLKQTEINRRFFITDSLMLLANKRLVILNQMLNQSRHFEYNLKYFFFCRKIENYMIFAKNSLIQFYKINLWNKSTDNFDFQRASQ